MKFFKSKDECPPGYTILCVDNPVANTTRYQILFKGKDTGWSGTDVNAALREAKKMARNK
jgi:hypothetical protein